MRQLRIEVLAGTALRLVGPAGEVLGRRELAVGEIDALVDQVTSDYEAYAPRLRAIGNRLYSWLDGSDQRWLTKARESLRGEVLCVRLDVGHRLRHLPWELAAVEGAFLVADVANPFCPLREVDERGSEHPVSNRPLRALFMASSPDGVLPLLDFEAEEARILAAAGAGGVDLVVEERGSLGSLAEILKRHGPGHFDVVHLSGHADVTADLGPHLLLERETGGLDRCSADHLIAAVEGHWPRVLFVSGCRTGQSPERGVAPSFAEQLVRAGAPCVVGWGQPVGDAAATAVAAALYARLGNGEDPASAIARARRDALDQGFRDWHLLRAYVDGSALVPLVTPPATPSRPRIQRRAAHREFLDADQRSPVCPADRFVGRRRVLQRCLRRLTTLDQSSRDYAEGVVLYGMGGLGKSSVAARLCERMPAHRRLVWVGPFDERELVRLMNAKLDAATSRLLNELDLPLRIRLRDVLRHVDTVGAAPLLFVLDDFEHNVEGHDDGLPRLAGPGGSALLTTAALDALDALTWAIRETASPSRVIVTCRYVIAGPPAPARLSHVGLEAMAGAELTKKTAQLARLTDLAGDAELRVRALTLADGNPRLLELLDKAMDLGGVDTVGVLAALGQVTADFRERVLVDALLDAQSDDTRRVLACLAVCRLALDAAAVSAIADTDATAALAAAMAAGLVESGPDPATSTVRYRVLALVADRVADAIAEDEVAAATDRAATRLHETWWATGKGLDEPRALELLRLCRAAGHSAQAIGIATAVTAAWHRQGRYAEAVALREQVVADRERLLGPEHPDTLSARASLAVSYWSAGRTSDAIAIEEQVVADRERLLGPGHHATLTARANLATSYWSAGRMAEAALLREQVVADRERLLGPEHLDTVSARANLAISYWSAGRTADAIAIEERVVVDRERLVGAEHPDTLTARNNLANSYLSAGRTHDAVALLAQLLADRERLLGPDHPDTVKARANLAASYWSAGSTSDAIVTFEQVVADRIHLLGPDHPETLTARANLAACYWTAGRTADAIALQEQVLSDRERLLGLDHPDTVKARGNLATSYWTAGRTADAITIEEQVLSDRERLLGPDHPDTLKARANLAVSYSSAGRTAEAIALLEHVLSDRERLLGPEHRDTLTARANLDSLRHVGGAHHRRPGHT